MVPSPGLVTPQTPSMSAVFWNLVAPLTLLLTIEKLGIRTYELGLIIALCINPHIIGYVVYYPILAWTDTIFLMMWVEKMLRRWAWYRMFDESFLKTLVVFTFFYAVPILFMMFVWVPIFYALPSVMAYITTTLSHGQLFSFRDVLKLLLALGLMSHSIYLYRTKPFL
ncbi:uncharacterized protein LOC131949025 [Physella acuta]|uniref:uncharacterized protein LOC131949025 n=1 Tax=Physella acuta TaxID=109671 RepID=UPI0027DE8D9F|nr:uncharacterized protein LOC131949025 [Physella acuta]